MKKGSIYELDVIPPLTEAVPLGLQHLLAMFAGNITLIIIVAGLFIKPLRKFFTPVVTGTAVLSIGVFKYGFTFHWDANAAMLIMYIVTAVETVGDISGITISGLRRETPDNGLLGRVISYG